MELNDLNEDSNWLLIKKNVDFYLNKENLFKKIWELLDVDERTQYLLNERHVNAEVFQSRRCLSSSQLIGSIFYNNPEHENYIVKTKEYIKERCEEMNPLVTYELSPLGIYQRIIALLAFNSFFQYITLNHHYDSKRIRSIYINKDKSLCSLDTFKEENNYIADLFDVLTGEFYKKHHFSFTENIILISNNKNLFKKLEPELKTIYKTNILKINIDDIFKGGLFEEENNFPINKINGYCHAIELTSFSSKTRHSIIEKANSILSQCKVRLNNQKNTRPCNQLTSFESSDEDTILRLLNTYEKHSHSFNKFFDSYLCPSFVLNKSEKQAFIAPPYAFSYYNAYNYLTYISSLPIKKKIKLFVNFFDKLSNLKYVVPAKLHKDLIESKEIDEVTFTPIVSNQFLLDHSFRQKNCMSRCWQHRLYFTNYTLWEVKFDERVGSLSLNDKFQVGSFYGKNNASFSRETYEKIQSIVNENYEYFKEIRDLKQNQIVNKNQKLVPFLRRTSTSYYLKAIEDIVRFGVPTEDSMYAIRDRDVLYSETNVNTHFSLFNIANYFDSSYDPNDEISVIIEGENIQREMNDPNSNLWKLNYEEVNIGQYKALRSSSPELTIYKIPRGQFLPKVF